MTRTRSGLIAIASLLGQLMLVASASAADDELTVRLGRALDAIARDPASAARKDAWRAAMRLDLPAQAAALDAALDPSEQAEMEGKLIAQDIRHGRIDAATLRDEGRYRRLDAALARTDALERDLRTGRALDAESQRRLFDRIGALVARQRPAEAVALYEALRAAGVVVPGWALVEAGHAHLAVRRPAVAAELYRAAIAAGADGFDAHTGLFYALSDLGRYDEASAAIDAYATTLPPRRRLDGAVNGERWSAFVASDQSRLYAGRIDEASRRVEARVGETPFNGEARGAEASLQLARGWPRAGEASLRRNLGRDPGNASLHADHAESLLGLQRWDEAAAALAEASRLAPDAAAVRRAGETFALHGRPELYLDAGYDRGQPSGPYGSRDWRVDTWLYSRPLAGSWRIFAHNYSTSGDFDGQWTDWIRTGAGVEWRSGDWRATGEVNGGAGEKAGVLATLRWQPSDHWRLGIAGDSLTNDIPLKAVRAGVTASRVAAYLDWSAHESRKLSLGLSGTDFSDDNRRRSLNLAWFERWLGGPRWQLETTLGADASENSLGYAAAYFSPPRDRSVWLAGSVDQLVWRDYERSFRHRLALTVGSYWQADYGSGAINAVEYQHRWEVARDLSLRYGIGRALRPYDGVREARNFANLTMLWRF